MCDMIEAKKRLHDGPEPIFVHGSRRRRAIGTDEPDDMRYCGDRNDTTVLGNDIEDIEDFTDDFEHNGIATNVNAEELEKTGDVLVLEFTETVLKTTFGYKEQKIVCF